jgi:hypothetical protein
MRTEEEIKQKAYELDKEIEEKRVILERTPTILMKKRMSNIEEMGKLELQLVVLRWVLGEF